MLKTLTDKQKTNWKESLNKLIYAYNCTRCEVTGFSPFYLLFGRSPRLPVDLLFGLTSVTGKADHQTYMEKWRREMQEAYKIVQENAKKSTERGKKHYDGKVKSSVLYPGDRVLVRNLTPRGGTGKLRNHWEETIHVVIRQVGEDVPVYEVKPEQGRGRSRILHRNLLLPCDYLPLEIHPKGTPKQKKRMSDTTTDNTNQEEEDDEDEEDEYYYRPVVQPQMPMVDKTTERVDTQEDSDPETPVLSTDESVVEERPVTNTNKFETQQENVLQDDDNQGQDVQPDEETQDEIPVPLYPDPPENDRQQGYDLPRRERRAPKIFTYDQLGTPVCYSAAHTNDMLYQPQPILYTDVQPVTMWMSPFPVYQPFLMQGH